jgi:ABC-type nitrate/sulfonate/bicarbonate transport system substrate-binding protein
MDFMGFEGATKNRPLGALIVFVSYLFAAGTLPAQERSTVLYPSPAESWMIPVIAKEAKYFEKEGIALEYVRVGGSTRIIAALLGRSAPIIQAGEPAGQCSAAPMS